MRLEVPIRLMIDPPHICNNTFDRDHSHQEVVYECLRYKEAVWLQNGAYSGECNQRCLAAINQSVVFHHRRRIMPYHYSRFLAIFLKVAEQGGSPFTGDRMFYVRLTLPYMIGDIAGSERRLINGAIRSASQGDPLRGAPLVEDPCEKIVKTLLDFLRWFLLIRR